MKLTKHRVVLGFQLIVPFMAATVSVAAVTPNLSSPKLLGADEIISRVANTVGVEVKPKGVQTKSDAERLMDDLESFKNVRGKLSAADAVERWLKLYDRYRQLPATASAKAAFNPFSPPNIRELSLPAMLAALPVPGSWGLLRDRLVERQATDTSTQDNVTRLVLFYITRDQSRLEKGLAELKSSAALGGNRSYPYTLRELRPDDLRAEAGNNGAVTADSFAAYLQSLASERPKGLVSVQVPDLVTLAGEKRAEELLTKALSLPGVGLNVPSGGATLKLAKRVVLNKIDSLTEPQWELITSIDDVELYEAINKRFPEKTDKQKTEAGSFQRVEETYESTYGENPRQSARINYILGLISRKRIDDAVKLAKGIEDESFQSKQYEKSWHSFDKLRHADGLNSFCIEVLKERPELPLWQQCGLIAATSGKPDKLVAILNAAAIRPNLPLEARMNIQERKVDLLLSIDRVDEGIGILRETLAYDAEKDTHQTQAVIAVTKLKFAKRLSILGSLLNRPDLVIESEQAYLSSLAKQGQGRGMAQIIGSTDEGSMVESLIEAGRLASAEQVVMASIQSMLQAPELTVMPGARDLALLSGILKGYLVQLVEIYARADRYDDVLTLLEKAAWWGATDLLDLTEQSSTLSSIVARALYKAGRNSEALELVTWHLLATPGDDAAYQVLTDIRGVAAIAQLDQLHARDRFEERPLIWKATLLKREGKLEEAEKVIRQALKIDPTDGEQKAGDRGRAYVVLAEILKARGKQDDAAFFERVVQAVRIAETGDRMTKAGLLKKSLNLYEQASDLFADAYCVQWRLAERLSSMGDMAGARKHYEIAFERMPEQFGQVASVCFGCEGVFTHQQSVSVAEEVLTNLAKSSPDKPQVQYLLGQLRESQGLNSEAYRHFNRAATLDPEYLDALKSAYSLRNSVFLGQAEMDTLALRMLRLDPLLRHNGLEPGEISDVKGVWEVYAEQPADRALPAKSLLPLTASKLEIEAMLKKFGSNLEALEMKRGGNRDKRSVPEAGESVVRNQFVQKLLRIASQNSLGIE